MESIEEVIKFIEQMKGILQDEGWSSATNSEIIEYTTGELEYIISCLGEL